MGEEGPRRPRDRARIYRFIHAEKANYPITLLCKVTKTARSPYYAWVAGREAREARRRADEALAHEITVIHLASRQNYGVPRVTANCAGRTGRSTASGWHGSCGNTASPGTAGASTAAA